MSSKSADKLKMNAHVYNIWECICELGDIIRKFVEKKNQEKQKP